MGYTVLSRYLSRSNELVSWYHLFKQLQVETFNTALCIETVIHVWNSMKLVIFTLFKQVQSTIYWQAYN